MPINWESILSKQFVTANIFLVPGEALKKTLKIGRVLPVQLLSSRCVNQSSAYNKKRVQSMSFSITLSYRNVMCWRYWIVIYYNLVEQHNRGKITKVAMEMGYLLCVSTFRKCLNDISVNSFAKIYWFLFHCLPCLQYKLQSITNSINKLKNKRAFYICWN